MFKQTALEKFRMLRALGGIHTDGANEIKLEVKVNGSSLTGTHVNRQMPGAIGIRDGKIEGNKSSFDYVRQMTGSGYQNTLDWNPFQ